MDEKILIKSEQHNVKKIFMTIVIIGVILSVIMSIITVVDCMDYYDSKYQDFLKHTSNSDGCWYYKNSRNGCWKCEFIIDKHPTRLDYVLDGTFDMLLVNLIPLASLTFIGVLVYLWLGSYELIVTDKRIYGKVAFGKRVDLPVDSVSATSTIRMLKGVSVSTSSGRISFLVVKNADEIYKVVSNLLIERQQKKFNTVVTATAPMSDGADQLRKYKDLLDSGVITQEEFDAKKKQLLDL